MMNRAHSRQVYLHASARDVVVPAELRAAFGKSGMPVYSGPLVCFTCICLTLHYLPKPISLGSNMPVFSQHCQTSKPL